MNINLEGFKSGADKVVAPARAFGEAMLDTTEKALSMQMDSCKVYSDIMFKQLKKMPEVTSVTQAGELFWGQIEPMSEFNKQMLKDWKSLVALNTEFAAAVKGAFTSQDEEVAETSKPEAARAPQSGSGEVKPTQASAAPQTTANTVKKISSSKRAPRATKTATTAKSS